MENKAIAKTLRLLSQLIELHNENPFKVRSLANAAHKVDKLPFSIAKKSLTEIEQIDGIGKSIATKIWELLETETITELHNYLDQTPTGVVEILRIKGLGPKKVQVIWKDLGIESVGELFYACNENRLIEAKGFGSKTQEETKKAIEFQMASSNRHLYAHVENLAENLLSFLKNLFPDSPISFIGDFRRRCEIIDGLDILIAANLSETKKEEIEKIDGLEIKSFTDQWLEMQLISGIKAYTSFCKEEDFAYLLAIKTGNETHIEELVKRLGANPVKVSSETEVYEKAGLRFIEPELREGIKEFDWAEKNILPKLIQWEDLRGSLHNHSNWSDGINTLEEMALFCRDELKLEYLGICDHSKSAVYAKGLTETRVIAQQQEIDELNKKLEGFKIFKGTESDILYDGSLDYPAEILSTFDFVVASIHSVFKMSQEKATARLIKAIENPFTTILGHPTGRLLLSRSGYSVDFIKIIDACAANNVVIEINANPLRLDMDWRWHYYAIEKGVMLSINPDAHRKEGFYDTRYGILAARKGGVSTKNCLNSMRASEIYEFFKRKKSLSIDKNTA